MITDNNASCFFAGSSVVRRPWSVAGGVQSSSVPTGSARGRAVFGEGGVKIGLAHGVLDWRRGDSMIRRRFTFEKLNYEQHF